MSDFEDFLAELGSGPSLQDQINSHRDQQQQPSSGAATSSRPRPVVSSTAAASTAGPSSKRPRDESAAGGGEGEEWACPMCTFLNKPSTKSCEMCLAPIRQVGVGLAIASARDGSSAQAPWVCADCSFLNSGGDSSRKVCQQCRRRKNVAVITPAAASSSSTIVVKQEGEQTCNNADGQAECGASKPAVAYPTSSDPPRAAKSSPSSSSSSSTSSEEEDDDEEDDDLEVIDVGRPSKLSDDELRHFLERLDTVNFEDLPLAPIPRTMIQRPPAMPLNNLSATTANPNPAAPPALRPFQQQGLHWLLQQEGHVKPSTKKQQQPSPIDSQAAQTQQLSSPTGVNLAATASSSSASLPASSGPSRTFSSLRFRADDDVDGEGEGGGNGVQCKGGILADYMGLGKTRTLIALCEATSERNNPRRGSSSSLAGRRVEELARAKIKSSATFIVCPLSMISQWVKEIKRCVFPAPKVLRYHGVKRGQTLFAVAQQFDYVITTYGTLARDLGYRGATAAAAGNPPAAAAASSSSSSSGASNATKLQMILWKRLILDEAHYIRNPSSCAYRACSLLCATYRWAVTATPIQNRLDDLFSLTGFLQIPRYSDRKWWMAEIANPLEMSCGEDTRARAALQLLMSSVVLRRLPTSTVQGVPILTLPPKEVRIERMSLSPEEQDFYDAVYKNAAVKLDGIVRRNTALQTYSCAFEMLVRCRQACLHPYIVVAALQKKRQKTGEAAAAEADQFLAPFGEQQPAQPNVPREIKDFVNGLRKEMEKNLRRNHLAAAGGNNDAFVEATIGKIEAQALSEDECIICLDLMAEPVILPCLHMFCKGCIENALAAGSTKQCPLCKAPVRQKDIRIVPQAAQEAPAPPQAPGIGPMIDAIPTGDENAWMESTKVKCLLAAIANIPPNEKIVVFSFFLSFLKFVEKCLRRHDIASVLFSGGLSSKQRDRVLNQFSTGPCATSRVLLATITSCGVGLTLTEANHCFIMEPSWNPAVEEQAMNRIYRIGQNKPVTITRFIAKGTVEEAIEKLADVKRALSEFCCTAGRGGGGLAKSELLGFFAPKDDDGDDDDDDDEH